MSISGEQDAQISQGGGDLQNKGRISNAHSATIHPDSLGLGQFAKRLVAGVVHDEWLDRCSAWEIERQVNGNR